MNHNTQKISLFQKYRIILTFLLNFGNLVESSGIGDENGESSAKVVYLKMGGKLWKT